MDINQLLTFINSDPHLTSQQKNNFEKDDNKKNLEKLLSGAGGAALMLAIAKYMKLGRVSQVMLAALGFGIGRVVFDYYQNHHAFAQYNSETGTYNIDTKRF